MDKLVIGKDVSNNVTINKDSYIVINEEVQSTNIEFNILDCKATIIDMGGGINKNFNFKNSRVTLIELINSVRINKLVLNNENSNIEYNVIDLYDNDINYEIESKSVSEGSVTKVNIASVCYKDRSKNYIVNTSNIKSNTVNEISCFGIVKDKSILNYDVTSFIEKGAKKSVVRQNSNILLFDECSLGKNNPILVIEENDVKASHGSSIGKIDDDTMFYLCSRGLTKNEATNLICLGKIEYLIKKIEDEKIKELLINRFKERMG
jgi:Fe-S cluster assembly protein SufD